MHNTLALLLLSYLYLGHGEEVGRQQNPMDQTGKSRGEILAIETNSELVSSSSAIKPFGAMQTACGKDGSMCLTCRSVGMCQVGVLTEVPCRGLYPYCDSRTGSCTSERRRCKEEEKVMSCPAKGYFPDPQSCRSFHICEGDPLVSYKFSCSPLQIFDHEEKKCARPSFRVRCTNFACFGKQGRYTPYPSDHSIYTLCADAYGTAMLKCPDNQEFDESKQKCVTSCSSEDNMADSDDEACRKYYRCVKSGRKFEAVPSLCPGQRVFDPKELKCVPKSPSFKCPNGSAPPTTTQQSDAQTTTSTPSAMTTQASSPQKELSVGETEETFYRQNSPLNQGQGKSASIIGSVYNKEHVVHGGVQSLDVKETPLSKSHTAFTTTLPVSVAAPVVPTSNENLGAVLSMLSDQTSTTDSHSSSKIVVRQIDTNLNKEVVVSKTESSTNSPTHPVTVSTSPSSHIRVDSPVDKSPALTTVHSPSSHIRVDSPVDKSPVLTTVHSTQTDKTIIDTAVATTSTLFGKQTYKVITETLVSTTPSGSIQTTAQSPKKEEFAKVHEISGQNKIELKASHISSDIENGETLPSQIFNTKESDKVTSNIDGDKKDITHQKTGIDVIAQLKPSTEVPSTTVQQSSNEMQKLKGSEDGVSKTHIN